MKVRAAIKRICGYCQVIRRGKKIVVRCMKNKRHKQRQGFSTLDANFKINDPKYCECSETNLNNPMDNNTNSRNSSVKDVLDSLNRNI
jgi:ribosomal protein L36